MLASRDWEVRFDTDAGSVGQRRLDRPPSCARRSGQFFDLRYAAEKGLNLAFARCATEAQYAARIASLIRDDTDCDDYFSASLLFARERSLLPGLTVISRILASRADRGYYPTNTGRKYERKKRHAHGVFVAYHSSQAEILDSASLSGKFDPVPVLSHKHEVPYGFLPEIPWYLSCRGRRSQVALAITWIPCGTSLYQNGYRSTS